MRDHANWARESLVALVDPVVRTPEPSVIKMELSTAATSWLDYQLGEGYDVCMCTDCNWQMQLVCIITVRKVGQQDGDECDGEVRLDR